jgi:hypothetical protein
MVGRNPQEIEISDVSQVAMKVLECFSHLFIVLGSPENLPESHVALSELTPAHTFPPATREREVSAI